MSVQQLEFHPAANVFPVLESAALRELADDIRAHGLREPITLLDGKVLDGRNRHDACLIAGVEPTFNEFNGDDAIAFVISMNLRRRHLDASQRAMVAAELANMRQGERTDLKPAPVQKVSRKAAAAALHVSERSVASAAVVRDQGAPELVKTVEAGDIPVKTASGLARAPVEDQREFIKNLPRDEGGKLMPNAKKLAKAQAGRSQRRAAPASERNSILNDEDRDKLVQQALEARAAELIEECVTSSSLVSARMRRSTPTRPWEERWQISLSNICDEVLARRSYWDQEMPGWRTFDCPSDVREAVTVLISLAATVATRSVP